MSTMAETSAACLAVAEEVHREAIGMMAAAWAAAKVADTVALATKAAALTCRAGSLVMRHTEVEAMLPRLLQVSTYESKTENV